MGRSSHGSQTNPANGMNDAGHTHEHMLKHDSGRIRDVDATLTANSHQFLPVRADSRQTLATCFEFTRSKRW
ncbi:hypothetical protein EGJ86_18265 [Pseudomonas sp. o96-267]|nr:hypothetical protein EGJ86_18265 [Pseudomonas sp. o96-267]